MSRVIFLTFFVSTNMFLKFGRCTGVGSGVIVGWDCKKSDCK
jgi:hypothetical protein